MPPEPSIGTSDEEARISAEVATLHDAAFGGDACSPETYLVDDVVICLITVPLLPSEDTLMTGGAGAHVRHSRRELEHSLRSSLTAVIEHTTGREVVAFFTDVELDPPLTVDLFRLAPAVA